MISLKFRFEPPFNEITKGTNQVITFDQQITVKELLEFFKEHLAKNSMNYSGIRKLRMISARFFL